MSEISKKLRVLCSTCVLAPQNRNCEEDELRPYCTHCMDKWTTADEIDRLQGIIDQIPKLVEFAAIDTIRNFLKYGHEMSERDCYPSLYRRGDKWRYHRRIAGNEWEDDVNPVAAAEKARK